MRGRGPKVSLYKTGIAILFLSSVMCSSLIKGYVPRGTFGRPSEKERKNYRPWEDEKKGYLFFVLSCWIISRKVAMFRKKKVLHRYKAIGKYSRFYCATNLRTKVELLEGATSTLVKCLLNFKEKVVCQIWQNASWISLLYSLVLCEKYFEKLVSNV